MYPNGAMATPERVLQDFEAALVFPHIVETDENREVLFGMYNLSAIRTQYEIDPTLGETEAIQAIQDAMNAPVPDMCLATEEIQATSLASIAASMEYQSLMMQQDAENTNTPDSTDPSKDAELA